MMETITKPKKYKIALPERLGNNFYRLCEKFKVLNPDTTPFEEYLKLYKPMTKALSSIMTIMENGHPTDPDDMKDIMVVTCNSKKDIQITFKRYRQCKLQPIAIIVNEFNKGVVEIEPSIPNIGY